MNVFIVAAIIFIGYGVATEGWDFVGKQIVNILKALWSALKSLF